ncbi:probable inorganic phosphate transporter 1-9 [Impatiens glandulifera]|uniref:probable inorganic phosphate transporter 1-9 n=1 Tax=Impatiens glandulifera TaxID=253017 RepID=UPI001FB1465A|nr:probable inorganic phosphate transporter 1-9 [Impatiens glandulifera]
MALRILTALDIAKTQFYHFKAIAIAGMGLFTDAYDLFCISPIMLLIGSIYYKHDHDQKVPTNTISIMLVISLLGAVIGQLIFGRLGDRKGRRRVYGLALMIMILSSIGCGLSVCTSKNCVLGSLGFFRFLLGIGIGGDYPLSATIMSEFSNRNTRGRFMAGVFSMQGFGILTSSIVTMVVCSVFKAVDNHDKHVDLAWRIILAIGAVPAGLTFYWRMMMPETARYTALVERNVTQATINMKKVLDVSLSPIPEVSEDLPPHSSNYPFFSKEFFRRHGRDLFSCSITWLLIDIIFYSSNLVQPKIYKHYLSKDSKPKFGNPYQEAFDLALLQAIMSICFTIPGYWATVYFIDRIGRVKIQIMGFFCMSLPFLALGIPYYWYWHHHTNNGFLILYGLTLFFANFGPNTTTFIVPAELFPARLRSTCHGISAAWGKVGAIIGVVGFTWASDENTASRARAPDSRTWKYQTISLVILGGVSIIGMIITYVFMRETNGRSLEENESDDNNMHVYVMRSFNYPCTGFRSNSPSSKVEGDVVENNEVA